MSEGCWYSDEEIASMDAQHEEVVRNARRLKAALDYVLPFVHVDIRDKALQMLQTPLENYIGSLGVTLKLDESVNWECDRCKSLTSTMLTRCYVCGTPRVQDQPSGES